MDEVLQRLVARANTGELAAVTPEPNARRPKTRMKAKHRRLLAQAKGLSPEDLQHLLQMLQDGAVSVSVDGELYLLRKDGDGWSVKAFHPEAPEYTVLNEACTCEDCKYRSNTCKHIAAVRRLLS